jgi:hypothetical protein
MKAPVVLVHVEPMAPPKPALGAACNGCGVCCLLEPCPLGRMLTGTTQGVCGVLRWHEPTARYLCGALVDPEGVARQALPTRWVWCAPVLRRLLQRLAPRWIAAATGCDCAWSPDPPK